MCWLLTQNRLSSRLALVDPDAARFAARCDLAQRNFFSDHLAGWVSSFAADLRECTGGGNFEPVGRFLAAWIPFERSRLGIAEGYADAEHHSAGVPVGQ
jgi:hypothetical protein